MKFSNTGFHTLRPRLSFCEHQMLKENNETRLFFLTDSHTHAQLALKIEPEPVIHITDITHTSSWEILWQKLAHFQRNGGQDILFACYEKRTDHWQQQADFIFQFLKFLQNHNVRLLL